MTWHEAIGRLEAQTESWAPMDVQVETQTWSEDPSVNVLVFAGANGRRVTLEPASWMRDEVPTAADLYSSHGQRVRLEGPDASGHWRFLTSDLLPLDMFGWDAGGFGHVLGLLLQR